MKTIGFHVYLHGSYNFQALELDEFARPVVSHSHEEFFQNVIFLKIV